VTEAEVRSRVMMFADGGSDPALAPEDLDVLISMCRVVDTNGLVYGEDNYEPTFNVNYAISLAWLIKAGRLANRYLFMSGGKMLSRQQYHDHCMKLHYKFAMKSGIRAERMGPVTDPIYAPNNWNP
jgi:hypothetical protein